MIIYEQGISLEYELLNIPVKIRNYVIFDEIFDLEDEHLITKIEFKLKSKDLDVSLVSKEHFVWKDKFGNTYKLPICFIGNKNIICSTIYEYLNYAVFYNECVFRELHTDEIIDASGKAKNAIIERELICKKEKFVENHFRTSSNFLFHIIERYCSLNYEFDDELYDIIIHTNIEYTITDIPEEIMGYINSNFKKFLILFQFGNIKRFFNNSNFTLILQNGNKNNNNNV